MANPSDEELLMLALRWAREPQPDLMMEVVPSTAKEYLLMHGWQYAFNNTVNGQRFTHKRSGFGDTLVVTSQSSPDYALRTSELIRTVAVVSLLSQFDIWAEMIPDNKKENDNG